MTSFAQLQDEPNSDDVVRQQPSTERVNRRVFAIGRSGAKEAREILERGSVSGKIILLYGDRHV